MENTGGPTPEQAAAALTDAEASRSVLARRLVVPSFFSSSIGAAVAVQIATTAVWVAGAGQQGVGGPSGLMLAGGLLALAAVATTQLVRFRRLNGAWLGGFASRVVGGTSAAASVSYVLSLGAAIWAAFSEAWGLVGLAALAGGVAYAVSGRRWVRLYRGEPAAHARGESAAQLAVLGALALTALVLLVVNR